MSIGGSDLIAFWTSSRLFLPHLPPGLRFTTAQSVWLLESVVLPFAMLPVSPPMHVFPIPFDLQGGEVEAFTSHFVFTIGCARLMHFVSFALLEPRKLLLLFIFILTHSPVFCVCLGTRLMAHPFLACLLPMSGLLVVLVPRADRSHD